MAGGYLTGSLPFGYWLVKALKGIDVRTIGSGNIGTTNVARAAGSKAAATVFALDVMKGLLPPLTGAALGFSTPWQTAAGLMAIVGHNYSIWLGFKGGKGIATSLGTLIGIAPRVILPETVLFAVALTSLRFVSLGSILVALALPILISIFYHGDHFRFYFGMAAGVLALYKHRTNFLRLMNGTEPRVHMPWTPKKAAEESRTIEDLQR